MLVVVCEIERVLLAVRERKRARLKKGRGCRVMSEADGLEHGGMLVYFNEASFRIEPSS